MGQRHLNLRGWLQAAMMAALIAVLAQISLPLPIGVPITLQTLAVSISAYILSPFYSTAAVAIYLGLGLIGLPVFANFRGGFDVLAGPSGGFLIGFLLMALLTGLSQKSTNMVLKIAIGIGGLAVCHLLGIIQLSILTEMKLASAFLAASLPFLPKDIASVAAAAFLGQTVRAQLIRARISIA